MARDERRDGDGLAPGEGKPIYGGLGKNARGAGKVIDMVYIAPSMREWLEKFYPGYVRLVEIGHVDLITEGMFRSYCAWCKRRRKK